MATSTIRSGLPRIDIAILKRMGLFRVDHEGNECVIHSEGQDFFVRKLSDENLIRILYLDNGCPTERQIALSSIDLEFGSRLCFDIDGDQCFTAYLDGEFCSPRFLGLDSNHRLYREGAKAKAKVNLLEDRLLGRNGLPKVRGRKRDRLLDELSQAATGFAWTVVSDGLLLEREQRVRRAARRPSRSSTATADLSTAVGLENGRRWFGGISEEVALERIALVGSNPPAPPATPPETIGFIEDHPVIDIRALSQAWDLTEAGLNIAALAWYGQCDAWIAADLRDFAKPRLVVDLITPEARPPQAITLTPASNAGKIRWYLSCPITGKRCDVLYLRDEVIGSAKALRLTYRSQRMGGGC